MSSSLSPPVESMTESRDRYGEKNLQRLQMFLYLTPIVGFFPSLWTLYRQQGTKEQQKVSRLSVTLALSWVLAYSVLATATTQTSEVFATRLLYTSGLLTTGYFLVCFGLMIRLWQHKPLKLPGVQKLSEGVVRKHLSE